MKFSHLPGMGGGKKEAKQRAETMVSEETSADSVRYTHAYFWQYLSCTYRCSRKRARPTMSTSVQKPPDWRTSSSPVHGPGFSGSHVGVIGGAGSPTCEKTTHKTPTTMKKMPSASCRKNGSPSSTEAATALNTTVRQPSGVTSVAGA